MDFFQAALGIVLIGCSTGIVCTAIDAIQKVKTKGRDQELRLANERMRQFGKVDIPQSAFIAALRMGDP